MPKFDPDTFLYEAKAVGANWRELVLARSPHQAACIARTLIHESRVKGVDYVEISQYILPQLSNGSVIGHVYLPNTEPKAYEINSTHIGPCHEMGRVRRAAYQGES